VRAQLGLPPQARVVLYAPAPREELRDREGRVRLGDALDVGALRAAAPRDTVVLYRPDRHVTDRVPATPDGFVRDVSTHPDASELLLAADVLITDYTPLTVDFARTGRPILFFAHDLDAYRDELTLDLEARAPGPLLATSGELAEALRDVDAAVAGHAERYARFAAEFCALDDGRASARVVDLVFGDWAG
jgi:CDP-glycerol glycerophosphotransferase